jgi:hypothetical protein
MSLGRRICAVVLLAGVIVVSSALAAGSGKPFRVTSTLDGKKVLPLRIHWIARPHIALRQVAEVDYLIDGRLAWVEHNAPYVYGSDGNWLVTSFLSPGVHTFTVRAVTLTRRKASDTVKARVLPAPAPPPELAGTWARIVTEGDAGRWTVTINSVGWLFDDPHGGGQNQDVSYPGPGQVLIRAAIEEPPAGAYKRGGAFCAHEPDPPGLYTYSVSSDGKTMTLTAVKTDCRQALLEGTWTWSEP